MSGWVIGMNQRLEARCSSSRVSLTRCTLPAGTPALCSSNIACRGVFCRVQHASPCSTLVKAVFASYNDWPASYASEAPGHLFPLACIQLRDLDAAIAE